MSTAVRKDWIKEANDNLPEDLKERIRRTQQMSKLAPPITINPERMGGTPVIGIHRLPVVSLIDYLMGGYTVDEFLDEFPGTDRDKVMAILQIIKDKLEEGWLAVEVDY
ncbi:MAG TPA: DUF433 domain-containing protein [Blastocatellia bacterium]|nr:DUF433 domain-containing protein [Blastocatellia bacterium]HMV85581.1 DUF433 domain-containing protein [Blastocatellia bacterium]HMX25710.1 DUF433 domain-containing protein [Blastocatellia bacterium]HMY70508.1 DUF433 domain-containing protein [Blastocatellia bacterium]HMZ20750.1 DUF433 domain-containing protein [Blastocatellia bacterium]